MCFFYSMQIGCQLCLGSQGILKKTSILVAQNLVHQYLLYIIHNLIT